MATKDPLVKSVVEALNITEGSDLNRWLKETVDESKDYHPMDVMQVAISLIGAAARRVRPEDPKVSDKLSAAAMALDRIVDSY